MEYNKKPACDKFDQLIFHGYKTKILIKNRSCLHVKHIHSIQLKQQKKKMNQTKNFNLKTTTNKTIEFE